MQRPASQIAATSAGYTGAHAGHPMSCTGHTSSARLGNTPGLMATSCSMESSPHPSQQPTPARSTQSEDDEHSPSACVSMSASAQLPASHHAKMPGSQKPAQSGHA